MICSTRTSGGRRLSAGVALGVAALATILAVGGCRAPREREAAQTGQSVSAGRPADSPPANAPEALRGPEPDREEPDLSIGLVRAVEAGDPAAVSSFLARGADVDALVYREPATHRATTPLCAAAETGNAELVQLLLAAGADPCLPSVGAYIEPLHIAAGRGDVAICALLLEAGADPLSAAKHEVTALQLARSSGSCETAKLLQAHIGAQGTNGR